MSVAISQKLPDEIMLSLITEAITMELSVLHLTLLLKGCGALEYMSDSS